jgi:hypothetical protein
MYAYLRNYSALHTNEKLSFDTEFPQSIHERVREQSSERSECLFSEISSLSAEKKLRRSLIVRLPNAPHVYRDYTSSSSCSRSLSKLKTILSHENSSKENHIVIGKTIYSIHQSAFKRKSWANNSITFDNMSMVNLDESRKCTHAQSFHFRP